MSRLESLRTKLRTFLLVRVAFHHVWQSGPRWMVATVALLFAQGLVPLFALYLMKLVVDGVAGGIASPDKTAAFGHVAWLIILAAAVGLFAAALTALSGIVREFQSAAFQDHMQEIILKRSVELDLEYYENSRYYDALVRAQQEGSSRPVSIVHGLVQIGQNSISLLAVASLLAATHWMVTAILLVAIVPGLIVRFRYADTLYGWHRRHSATQRLAAYFHSLLTTAPSAKEVRMFGLGPTFMRRHRELRTQLRQERFRLSATLSLNELVTQGFGIVAVFGVFAVLSRRVFQGEMTLGDLVMYYQGIQYGLGYMRGMLASFTRIYEDALFLSNLQEFLALRNIVAEPDDPVPVPRPIREGIAFEQVSFRYPGDERNVLRDVSLKIGPGEVVALVGENGAGKTTLIKLLCRLYNPDRGSITIDGVDLGRLTTAALRKEVCPIFQDYARYHLTASENIRLGDVESPEDPERVSRLARFAGADEFIRRLPRSYETQLGRLFAEGAELSVGQWQRIALARAFYRDGQVIILDEPTSALDPKAEYDFFQRFREMVHGRLAIIVSHRFSTVRMADRIYVLEGGTVIEHGSHEELMRLNGTYAGLYKLQAKVWL
ncbi:MAG: ABC transporter ATP-binding protein [Desulfomonile tiedjei]|nr:ABC transporter ATP-binding protein [Desulfomonile tiedjei]